MNVVESLLQLPRRRMKRLAPPPQSTLDLVEQLDRSAAAIETKAHMVQLHVNRLMNEELELLAEHSLQLNVEMNEPCVLAPISRGDYRGAADAVMSKMRRRFAKLLRDHQRETDEE